MFSPNVQSYSKKRSLKKRRKGSKQINDVSTTHQLKAKESVFQLFKEFCSNSSIHGLRYWVDAERHWIERVWWVLSFILSISCCLSLVYTMWQKWADCPVIINFEHRPLTIAVIPFPATTICPFVKTKSDVFNYTRVYRLISGLEGDNERAANETELKFMKVAAQTCDEWFGSEMRKHFDDNFTDSSFLSDIAQMAPTLEDTMVYCKLFNWVSNCSEIVFPIYTTEGLCFTFNSMNINDILTDEAASELKQLPSIQKRSKWDPEGGYLDEGDIDADVFPYRPLGMGNQEKFTAVMKFSNRDIDYLCGGGFDGFKVAFHLPNELPSIRRKHYRVSINRTAMVLISPNLIVASRSIGGFSPQLRQCYFIHEHKLRFFRDYTQQNCEHECLSNYTLEKCGCVHYSMTRSSETKVCGTRKIRCVMHAEKSLFTASGTENPCDCLPGCEAVSYNIQQSLVEFDFLNAWSKSRFPELIEFENSSFCRITLSFRMEHLLPAIRIELYNTASFLSETGGLFGFFIGASMLSFIELIYFFTLRPCFPQQRHTKSKKTTRSDSREMNKLEQWHFLN